MLSGIETATIATAAGGGGAGFLLMNIAPFLLIIVVFYFLLIRPQQQKMKKHQEMISNLRRGDEVVTQGGIVGKITKIADNDATVEIAEGVRVKVIKFTITEVRSRTEPANDSAPAKSDAKDGQ